jgi:hypothetical protein
MAHRVYPVALESPLGAPHGTQNPCWSSATAIVQPRYPAGIVHDTNAMSQFPALDATGQVRDAPAGGAMANPVVMDREFCHVLTTSGAPPRVAAAATVTVVARAACAAWTADARAVMATVSGRDADAVRNGPDPVVAEAAIVTVII